MQLAPSPQSETTIPPSIRAHKRFVEKWTCEACGLSRRNVILSVSGTVTHNCPAVQQFERQVNHYRSRGLGDTLARIFAWFGLKRRKGCGCKRRQKWLNKWFPYRS